MVSRRRKNNQQRTSRPLAGWCHHRGSERSSQPANSDISQRSSSSHPGTAGWGEELWLHHKLWLPLAVTTRTKPNQSNPYFETSEVPLLKFTWKGFMHGLKKCRGQKKLKCLIKYVFKSGRIPPLQVLQCLLFPCMSDFTTWLPWISNNTNWI